MEPEDVRVAPEAGSEAFHIHCIDCGTTSPPLSTDAGLRMWVAVHLCRVPVGERTWFVTYLGEEMGDGAVS